MVSAPSDGDSSRSTLEVVALLEERNVDAVTLPVHRTYVRLTGTMGRSVGSGEYCSIESIGCKEGEAGSWTEVAV